MQTGTEVIVDERIRRDPTRVGSLLTLLLIGICIDCIWL